MAITSKEIVAAVKGLTDIDRDLHLEDIPDAPSFFWRLSHLDPAVYRGIVVSIVCVLAAFGLIVSDQSAGAIVAVVSAIAAIVQAVWTRKAVTPNQKVLAYKPDPVDSPALIAAGAAVSSDVIAVANAAAKSLTNPLESRATLPFPLDNSQEH